MPKALREAITDAFADLLRGVTPAGGAEVDLSGCVHVGRAVFGREDGALVVSINERADQQAIEEAAPAKADSPPRLSTLPFVVQGFCEEVSPYTVSAEVVKAIVAEVQRAKSGGLLLGVAAADSPTRGLVLDLLVGQPLVRPSDNSRGGPTEFWLQVTIQFAENRMAPFL